MTKFFTLSQFKEKFSSPENCYEYLAKIKWAEGYSCRKCGQAKYIKGKRPYSRRCCSCGYDESPTAQTLFHQVKFEITEAFYFCYRVTVDKKGVSSMELQRETARRQKTCWYFRRKIQEGMKGGEEYFKAGGNSPVADVCKVTDANEDARDKTTAEKNQVFMLIDKIKSAKGTIKMGKAYAGLISKFYPESVSIFAANTVRRKKPRYFYFSINEEGIKEYLYPIIQKEEGASLLAIQLSNIKRWLKGIHHHCSEKHEQSYLDEYHFRFNKRMDRELIFTSLLNNMVAEKPLFMKLRDASA